MKPKINLDELEINGVPHIVASFKYNQSIITAVKSIGMRWQESFKYWTIPNTKTNYKNLINVVGKVAYIEQDDLVNSHRMNQIFQEKVKIEKSVNQVAQMHLNRFAGMLANKRYSKSTRNTYYSLLKTFFAFFYDRDPMDLTMEDVGDFNKEFILGNNYSVNTQRQFTSALKLFYQNTEGHQLEVGSLVARGWMTNESSLVQGFKGWLVALGGLLTYII